jgi:hypothetical protein
VLLLLLLCPACRSRAKYPHIRFEAIDAFDLEALKALSPTGSFDKICIDIGGIAELHTVMSLLGLYFRAFKKAVLIVKSKYLKPLLENAQVYVPPLEQKQKQERAQRHAQPLLAKQQCQHQQPLQSPLDGVASAEQLGQEGCGQHESLGGNCSRTCLLMSCRVFQVLSKGSPALDIPMIIIKGYRACLCAAVS